MNIDFNSMDIVSGEAINLPSITFALSNGKHTAHVHHSDTHKTYGILYIGTMSNPRKHQRFFTVECEFKTNGKEFRGFYRPTFPSDEISRMACKIFNKLEESYEFIR